MVGSAARSPENGSTVLPFSFGPSRPIFASPNFGTTRLATGPCPARPKVLLTRPALSEGHCPAIDAGAPAEALKLIVPSGFGSDSPANGGIRSGVLMPAVVARPFHWERVDADGRAHRRCSFLGQRPASDRAWRAHRPALDCPPAAANRSDH